MTKNRVTGILYGFIVCLVIAIFILVIMLSIRPESSKDASSTEQEEESDVLIQEGNVDESIQEDNLTDQGKDEIADQNQDLNQDQEEDMKPMVSALQDVNIRAGESAGSDKVGALLTGETVELIETLDSGWTKVMYQGQEAFIKSEYIELVE